MGQQEVIKYLEKKKEATPQEIAIALNISKSAINSCLRKMRKYKEVDYYTKTIKRGRTYFYFKNGN